MKYIAGFLTAIVALGAFVLSFDAQRKAAVAFGVSEDLAWIVPLVIDVSIVVFSLLGLHAVKVENDELRDYSATWTKRSIGTTLLFNFTHASKVHQIIETYYSFELVFEIVYAISAPVFVAALVHAGLLLIGDNKADTESKKLKAELSKLKNDIFNFESEITTLKSANARLKTNSDKMQFGFSVWNRLSAQSQKFLTAVLIDGEMTNKEYADLFNVQPSAISNTKKVMVLEDSKQ